MTPLLLEVRGLCTRLSTLEGSFLAVEDVSFEIAEGSTVGLLGESGCGKSLTALSLMRLVPESGRITGGSVLFRGSELLRLAEEEMRAVRGNQISMVFQEPITALNPLLAVGEQIAEAPRLHQGLSRVAAQEKAVALLTRMGIADPARCARAYPHQLSGGMRQRVLIALALSCAPALLIADEPTSSLDVTVQAQLLELLGREQRERRMALLLITHDLGLVAESCEEVVVMYAGRVVERAPVRELFATPAHPYTAALLRAHPSAVPRGERLPAIPGRMPAPLQRPLGCRFRDRCDRPAQECLVEPRLERRCPRRHVACHRPLELPGERR